MLGTSWVCHKVREFALRPMGDFFTGVGPYGHGGHLGHVTWTIYINFGSPFLRMLHMKFGYDWPSGFRGEDL